MNQAAHFVKRNLALCILLKNAIGNGIELKSFDPKRANRALDRQATVIQRSWSEWNHESVCSGHVVPHSVYFISFLLLEPCFLREEGCPSAEAEPGAQIPSAAADETWESIYSHGRRTRVGRAPQRIARNEIARSQTWVGWKKATCWRIQRRALL